MSRPILVIDTSVFLHGAFSKARRGAASQVLAIAPAVAHIVMCEEIRDEIFEKVDEYLHSVLKALEFELADRQESVGLPAPPGTVG